MQKIKIVCVGKIKERYLTDAISEYAKRISRFADLKIVELPESTVFQKPNGAQEKILRKNEGEKILEAIQNDVNVILLCVEGKQQDSFRFSRFLEQSAQVSDTVTFVIGGSYGLDAALKAAYPQKLSFSQMTFPHQLMRVILLEQIYRGFKIIRNESYHK